MQNGYLGEFTDMTVYELLGNYRSYYDNEVWGGGTTDDGSRITEVYFSNLQSSDSTTIQFEMLNDDVFYVSAYVDTGMPGAQRSDVVFALTSSYYSGIALEYLGDNENSTQLNTLLREVDASIILYGASANYTGDRASLYKLRDDKLLGMSSAELMEYHGMAIVDPPSDYLFEDSQSVEPTTEYVEDAADIQFAYFTADELLIDMDQNVLRASQKYNDTYLTLTGRVSAFNADGKAFVMGGTSYNSIQTISCVITDEDQVADLMNANVGDTITIQCKVTKVDQLTGYQVEMISIEEIMPNVDILPETTEKPASFSPLTGTVLRSAGELNVRSGPGTNYGTIGRLYGGDSVTIYEQQNVNGKVWGNIGYGWVSMDYIVFGVDNSAAPTTDASRDIRSEYYGLWVSDDRQWCMTITPNGNRVDITVEQYYSPNGVSRWTMTGEFEENIFILYSDGTLTDYVDGSVAYSYGGCEGAIGLYGDAVEWTEFFDDLGTSTSMMLTRTDYYSNPYS